MRNFFTILSISFLFVSWVDYDPKTGKYTIDMYGDDFRPEPAKKSDPFEFKDIPKPLTIPMPKTK